MTTLQKLAITLFVVITMETLYANSSVCGENKLKILHNGAGSLTVKSMISGRAIINPTMGAGR